MNLQVLGGMGPSSARGLLTVCNGGSDLVERVKLHVMIVRCALCLTSSNAPCRVGLSGRGVDSGQRWTGSWGSGPGFKFTNARELLTYCHDRPTPGRAPQEKKGK